MDETWGPQLCPCEVTLSTWPRLCLCLPYENGGGGGERREFPGCWSTLSRRETGCGVAGPLEGGEGWQLAQLEEGKVGPRLTGEVAEPGGVIRDQSLGAVGAWAWGWTAGRARLSPGPGHSGEQRGRRWGEPSLE